MKFFCTNLSAEREDDIVVGTLNTTHYRIDSSNVVFFFSVKYPYLYKRFCYLYRLCRIQPPGAMNT